MGIVNSRPTADVSATSWTINDGYETYAEAMNAAATAPTVLAATGGISLTNASAGVTVEIAQSNLPASAAILGWRAYVYAEVDCTASRASINLTVDDSGNNLYIEDDEVFGATGDFTGWKSSSYAEAATVPTTLLIFGQAPAGATIIIRNAYVEVYFRTANNRVSQSIGLRI